MTYARPRCVGPTAGGASVTLNAETVVHESEHVDPLGETRPKDITVDDEILALQVQAFLEASEDVDVDTETIEDILEVLVGKGDEEDADEPPSESQMDTQDDSDESHDEEDAPIPSRHASGTPPLKEGMYLADDQLPVV